MQDNGCIRVAPAQASTGVELITQPQVAGGVSQGIPASLTLRGKAMPANWQQWMPFRIDAFKASPAVQAMHPCARIGYLYLLAYAWQTDDCTISTDPMELAEQSGLGDELWDLHGPRILRKFHAVPDSERLRNDVCHQEWLEAKRIFDSRREAADRTNSARSPKHLMMQSPDGHRVAVPSEPLRSADTRTGTETVTETEVQKPSRVKRERAAPSKTKLADQRHATFKEAIRVYWASKNKGVEMPWGPAEGKQLGMFLREAPHITLEQFTVMLRNRYKSNVNHGDRPSQWIFYVASYGPAPVDRFNKPIEEGSNGKSHQGVTSQRVKDARIALAEAALERGYFTVDDALGSINPAVSGAGDERRDSGVLGGLRGAGPEILDPER